MHYSLTTDGMPSGVSVVKTNVLEAKTLNPKTPLSRASADEVHIRPTPTTYTLHPTSYTLHPTPYTLHPTPQTLNTGQRAGS